jgi:hypothetical protein
MSLLDNHYCPITVEPSREVFGSGQSALGVVSARALEFAVFESVSTCDCNAYFCVVLTTPHDVITCPPLFPITEPRPPLYTHQL